MSETHFDLERIAHLARLTLSPEERTLFAHQLASIVGYVEKIGELDTDGIEPSLYGQPISNIFREDTPRPSLPPETVLANAPARIGDEIKMPRVVEEN